MPAVSTSSCQQHALCQQLQHRTLLMTACSLQKAERTPKLLLVGLIPAGLVTTWYQSDQGLYLHRFHALP